MTSVVDESNWVWGGGAKFVLEEHGGGATAPLEARPRLQRRRVRALSGDSNMCRKSRKKHGTIFFWVGHVVRTGFCFGKNG